MRKHSKTRKARAADPVTEAKLTGNASTGAVEKMHSPEGHSKARARKGKAGRNAKSAAPNEQWLREIARTAASVQWKRGD